MTVPDTVCGSRTTFLWLYLTDKCQLECTHCATGSGPSGTHGAMTPQDWLRVIDEAAALGVREVQFVGGEPTLYPHLAELIDHALAHAMSVEVFSNLVYVPEELWLTFIQPGVTLATSYYSDLPEQHEAVTGRKTYYRTRANIARANKMGIPVRAGVIDGIIPGQRAEQARSGLVELGVPAIGYDNVRALGRACQDGGSPEQLCGGCGDGVAAIGPDGSVRPCLFAGWLNVGNVRDMDLAAIVTGMPAAREHLIRHGMPAGTGCAPKGDECWPINCTPYRGREA
jgi:MoaA/NifB/PqqE/SkfB family radical SAM enzyme